MTAPLLSSGLLTSALLLPTACTVDVGRSALPHPLPIAAHCHGRSPSSAKARLPAADCAKSPKATYVPATCSSSPARRHFVWDPRLQPLFREPRRAVSGEQTEGRCGVKERFALSHPS